MHHAAPPPRYAGRGGAGTCALHLKRIEPFDQDNDVAASHPVLVLMQPPTEKRRSLSEMDFKSVIPTAALHAPSVASVTTRTPRLPTTSHTPSPPSDVLALLRSKTLLDYAYMREFSLAKRKPRSERNLSRMSSNSIYSIRISQMELQDQARRRQRLPLPTSSTSTTTSTTTTTTAAAAYQQHPSKAGDDTGTRVATPVSNESLPSTSHPPPRRFIRSQPLPSPPLVHTTEHVASTCSPTRWTPGKPSTTATPPTRAIRTLKYRHTTQPAPSTSTATSITATPPVQLAKPYLVATQPMVSDGISPFDLRKCHATSAVTAHHGFLMEQDLPALLLETGYDRSELYALWARFKALCAIAKSPRGIDKETFRRGISQLSVEDEFFMDRVFDILDADGSGILEWQEFVEALSALEKGDVTKRVTFLFRVYDVNGDGGAIHRHQMMQFILASLLVQTTAELVDVARHFVSKIFDATGCGDHDTMQIEDALRYMCEHPAADIYSLFGRTMVLATPRSAVHVKTWEVDARGSGP